MPAEGKDNAAGIAAKVAAGKPVRILITDKARQPATAGALAGGAPESRWYPASRKTKVVTATVTGADALMVTDGRRSARRYTLHTDRGDVPGLVPIETLYLAPEPKGEPAPGAATAAEPTRTRDASAGMVGQWLTRSNGTVGQVASVERYNGALGGDDCTRVEYTDGTGEQYLTRDLPEPVPTPTDVTAVEVDGTIVAFTSRVDLTAPAAEPAAEPAARRLVARRIPEVGCAVYDADTGEKVSPAGEAWWPNMRRANQAKDELLATGETVTPDEDKAARRADYYAPQFAGKFVAETVRSEPPVHLAPTDENLARTFAGCVKPAPVEMYDAIREQIRAQVAELHAEGLLPARYAVDDRVQVRNAGEATVGIVTGVHRYPDTGTPFGYDVHIIPAGVIPFTEDEMEASPVPVAGQRWISYKGGRARVVTVARPSPDNHPAGLVTDCEEVRGILLGAPHWRPLDESDPVDVAIARRADIAARPEVAAILKRAASLTDDERERLHTVGVSNYRLHRAAMIPLGHQARRAYGEHWHDLSQVAEWAWKAVNQASPTAASQQGFAGHAAADMVYALLAREHLNENEYRIFAGPWLDVIGVRA